MSDLSDKAILEIQNAVVPVILTDKAGNEYTSRQVHPVDAKELPMPRRINIATLTGLVDFIEASAFGSEGACIHIVSHSEVDLLSGVHGPAKQRDHYVNASFEALLGKSFTFGTFYEKESFVVGLQSLFEPTPERADVLKVIGTIKENQVREYADDGVTQTVSAKAGVALVSEIVVPNPVILQPFRTFREIYQPASPFILRVRAGKEMPQCALFEADGGRWKLEAIGRIKEFLEDKVNIPIFA